MGAQLTTSSQTSLTGIVSSQQNANVLAAILLLFLCIIPGIVYLVVARKTITTPFSAQVAPDGDGSLVTFTGQGAGGAAISNAVAALPT